MPSLSCGTQFYLWHMGSSSLIRDQTLAPYIKSVELEKKKKSVELEKKKRVWSLTSGPPGKSHFYCILNEYFITDETWIVPCS